MTNKTKEHVKEKIGTALDKDVVKMLKERSHSEGRPISDILQDAILRYSTAESGSDDQRLAAVKRLCSRPFNLTRQELDEIMEEDYFEQ